MSSSIEKTKLVVDTNAVNNDNCDGNFFGNMAHLQELSKYFDIVVPKIVLDEIVKHKYKKMEQQRQEALRLFKKNPIIKRSSLTEEDINNFKPTIDLAEELCKLPFNVEVIDISDSDACLKKMRDLALKNVAPFDNETDRGFKDAILALSIEEYARKNNLNNLVFISRDNRLTEYFEKNDSVVCFNSFDELSNKLDDLAMSTDDAKGKTETSEISGKVTIKESPQRAFIRSILSELRNAHNFKQVHEALSNITNNVNNMNPDDFIDTMISATDNNQIYWICEDPDVKDYYAKTFSEYGWLLPDDVYNDFVIKMGLDKSLIKQPKRPENDDLKFIF